MTYRVPLSVPYRGSWFRRRIVLAAPTCTLWVPMLYWDALIFAPWAWYCGRFPLPSTGPVPATWRARISSHLVISRYEAETVRTGVHRLHIVLDVNPFRDIP